MKLNKFIYYVGALSFVLGATFACSEEEPLNLPPSFNMDEASNILRTSVTLSGKISGSTDQISSYGFEYSLSEDFTANLTTRKEVGDVPSSHYSLEVKGLEANERYYYRMYASTGASTVFSSSQYFQTAASSAPIMSPLLVDSVGENLIRLKCTIEEIGDEYLIEYGVGYKTAIDKSYNPIPSDSIVPVAIAGAENTFYVEITGLEPATKYSFRPYAKNSADANGDTGTREGYGEILEKQTENQLSAVVETVEIMEGNIGINSVTVSGMIESAIGSNGKVDACGFCWSATNATPSIVDSHIEVDVPKLGEYFTGTISDLQPGMTYYVRAYAKNTVNGAERIGYGVVYEIVTANLVTPVLEWSMVKDEWDNDTYYQKVSPSTIGLRANIKNYDEEALVEKGLIWDKSNGEIPLGEAKKNKTYIAMDKGGNLIDGTIENLEMNTNYYVRAYAVYQAAGLEEIGYTSGSRRIRTEGFDRPHLDDVEIPSDSITRNSAVLIGAISSAGNGEITERGFCLSLSELSNDPKLDNCDIHVKSDETFTVKVKGLKYNTSYRVKSYVISKLENEVDTTYCGWANYLSTKDLVFPTFNNVAVNDEGKTCTSIPVSSKIVTVGDGKVIEKGFIWAKEEWDVTFENALGSIKLTEDEFEATITKLTPNTRYMFRAYAIVEIDSNKYTRYSDTRDEWTLDVLRPELDIDWDNHSSTLTSITIPIKINDKGQGEIIERGLCWAEYKGEWIDVRLENNEGSIIVTDTTEVGYTGIITGLMPSTSYYIRPYMKMKIDDYEYVSYAGQWHMNTQSISMDLRFDEILDTSCKVVGYLNESLPEGVTEYGFCWSAEDVNVSEMKNQKKASEPNENGEFTLTIDNLTTNTEYRIGMYIVYEGKKFYANGRWGFTTKRIPSINDNTSPDKKD